MRDRRDIADRGDGKAHRLQRPQCAFASRARALDLDFERADAMFSRLLARIVGRDLRRIGRRLAAALKPIMPAEDQLIALPWASVMVTMVLLKLAFTCAMPLLIFLRSRFLMRWGSRAMC